MNENNIANYEEKSIVVNNPNDISRLNNLDIIFAYLYGKISRIRFYRSSIQWIYSSLRGI